MTLAQAWLKLRGHITHPERGTFSAPVSSTRPTCGKGEFLYTYLAGRYAQRIVLTFSEIEDLLGFALPDQARRHREWWTNAATNVDLLNYADSWRLANRTASPNLLAQTVVFERTS
jgi:hypothetical protein